jgi:hypothetical protein
VGIILIVLIALYFYRRYTRRLKSEALAAYEKRARAKGNNDRLKGKSLENWNKMDEVGGAGNVQAKQAQIPTGMEQITMFQKSPTIRSPTSGQVMEQNNVSPFDNPFVPYPTPTKAISQSPSPHTDADSAPSISWDGETIGTDTFLSLRSDLAKSSGNVLSKAIPTPPAIEHEHHRWESAEVLHFGGTPDLEEKGQVQDRKDSVSVKSNKTNNNPFAIEVERRKSVSNPFFNARDSSNSSNSNLNTSIPPLPSAKALGKRREVDPFTDDMTIPVRPAAFTRHTPSDSNASYNSDRDRAIQSLVNVLEVSEEDVQERLRIASMQPSFISASSYQGEETDTALPLPPL